MEVAALTNPNIQLSGFEPKGVIVCRMSAEDGHLYGLYRDEHGSPPGQIRSYRMDREPYKRIPYENLPTSVQDKFFEHAGGKLVWSSKKRH